MAVRLILETVEGFNNVALEEVGIFQNLEEAEKRIANKQGLTLEYVKSIKRPNEEEKGYSYPIDSHTTYIINTVKPNTEPSSLKNNTNVEYIIYPEIYSFNGTYESFLGIISGLDFFPLSKIYESIELNSQISSSESFGLVLVKPLVEL